MKLFKHNKHKNSKQNKEFKKEYIKTKQYMNTQAYIAAILSFLTLIATAICFGLIVFGFISWQVLIATLLFAIAFIMASIRMRKLIINAENSNHNK